MEATLMRKLKNATLVLALAISFTSITTNLVSAQEGSKPAPIATGDKVYCAGFISDTKISYDTRIIGNPKEDEISFLYKGARAFMNKGQGDGIQVGDVYQILRPRGAFYHPFKNVNSFSRRGELLGYFSEEVGFVKVIAVHEKTSTIQIVESCGEVRQGDALVKYEKPQLPDQRAYTPIDPLAPSSGKSTGQIVTARNAREVLSASDVVIIDLGQKAGVKVGDYFTIFRTNGSEPIKKIRDDEVAFKNGEGGSERYRGNSYSITHPSIQKEKIRAEYPNSTLPRTVVGELVVTRVEGNTAVAIIVRTQGGEVFVGDNVELQ